MNLYVNIIGLTWIFFRLLFNLTTPDPILNTSIQLDSDLGVFIVADAFGRPEVWAAGAPLDRPMDTIFVKSVRAGSGADLAGLAPGDQLVSVNGESVAGRTYAQVVHLIQTSPSVLQLLVVPKEEDLLQLVIIRRTSLKSNFYLNEVQRWH